MAMVTVTTADGQVVEDFDISTYSDSGSITLLGVTREIFNNDIHRALFKAGLIEQDEAR